MSSKQVCGAIKDLQDDDASIFHGIPVGILRE